MANTKQQNWWDSLSKDEQDSINHALFHKKVFNLDLAYALVGLVIR